MLFGPLGARNAGDHWQGGNWTVVICSLALTGMVTLTILLFVSVRPKTTELGPKLWLLPGRQKLSSERVIGITVLLIWTVASLMPKRWPRKRIAIPRPASVELGSMV